MTSPGRGSDVNRELYPFLHETTPTSQDLARVLAEVSASTRQKCRDVVALRAKVLRECGDVIVKAGEAMAGAFLRGGKLLAIGNGGSATDAQDAAADCLSPPVDGWRALPALALVNDIAVVTAVANDVGFEHVFARQLDAFAAPGDIILAFSTSGNSPSIVNALRHAKRAGLLTVALCGYDGGAIAHVGCDFCIVTRAEYVPRIQEAQATVWHALLEITHATLAASERLEIQ
jgi:D-sedoheptulose 7-phosphate isomerase